MVASTHWLASSTGMGVLERGGNAADAAVAAGFVLQVVEPHLNGPGGEVPVLVGDPADESVSVVCGQGVSPAAASIEAFHDLDLDLVPGTGLLPAVVPGAFGGWLRLLDQWGTWSLRDVLAPAIGYAERGHPILARASSTIGRVASLFSTEWPTSAALWLPDGAVPVPRSRFVNADLAATYRRVVGIAEAAGNSRAVQIEAARRAWYEGFVAEAVDRFCANAEVMDTSGERHHGLLTADDLARWEATVEAPIGFDYHGHTVFKTGPWGQGPVFLQQLALLSGFDLTAMGVGSADWVHTVVECTKLAMADREAWYGDPAAAEVPVSDLLSATYNDDRRRQVSAIASAELRPGSPGGLPPRLPRRPAAGVHRPAAAGSGEPTVAGTGLTQGDTCHLDVVDAQGLMISATPSGGWLQASPTLPGLGFCLSSRGQMFWLEDGLPNSLRPSTRPRTTLSPSLALRDGEPWMAFGTPGGDFQDQWSLQFFLRLVHGGADLQRAIDAPNFHTTHAPSSFHPRDADPARLTLESRFDETVVAELRRRGHLVNLDGAWSIGRVSAVARDDGWLTAAADTRGSGSAVGR